MKNKEKKGKFLSPFQSTLLLALFCGLAFIASLFLGYAGFPSLQDETLRNILLHIRLPRALGGLLAGGALAMSGALVQSVLSNPLASTNLLGINAGAGFFGLLLGAIFPHSFWIGEFGSFLGALLCASFILLLIGQKKVSKLTILLAGLAVSQLFTAGIDCLILFFPEALNGYASFKIGSLASLSLSKVILSASLILPILVLVFCLSRELEMFSLGFFQATSIGFPISFWRTTFLALAALLAASVVSFCGMLGFVGLIVPAWLRSLRLAIPLYLAQCFFLGGLLCEVADLCGRTLFLPWELPAGLLLSFIGAPYFLWMVLERRNWDA